jgi:hypothetical protein
MGGGWQGKPIGSVVADDPGTRPAGPACARCRFFRPTTKSLGRCHRYAPRGVVVIAQRTHAEVRGGPETIWPPVAESDWCGEYESNQPANRNMPL